MLARPHVSYLRLKAGELINPGPSLHRPWGRGWQRLRALTGQKLKAWRSDFQYCTAELTVAFFLVHSQPVQGFARFCLYCTVDLPTVVQYSSCTLRCRVRL